MGTSGCTWKVSESTSEESVVSYILSVQEKLVKEILQGKGPAEDLV